MSTFGGRFKEEILECIAVDDFTENNRRCSAFFLSHLHTDHMNGLDFSFFQHLTVTGKFLYCSKVTETFLRKKKEECASNKNIVAIEVNQCMVIELPNKNYLEVTLISAGHCPGSVMFLFEKEDTKILYTGDFRLSPCDLPKFKVLHDSNNKVLKINSIYLDTTFAMPEYETFPSRDQSCGELINIVKEWICNGVNYKIGIVPAANYGLEFLVIELAKAVKQKIYIRNAILFANYKCIFELSDLVTNDSNSTQIHLCQWDRFNSCFECVNAKFIKRIKPSAMKFKQELLQSLDPECNSGIVDYSSEIISIAYSNHCSLQELKGFLKYLMSHDGCKIRACVIGKQLTEEQVLRNLDVQETHNEIQETTIQNTLNQDLSLTTNQSYGILESTEQNNNPKKSPVEIAKNIYGLHSPPRPKKRTRFN